MNISYKNTKNKTNNVSINIYVNKIETTELPECTKSKITKDENSESFPYLEITEVLLNDCNIVNNHHQLNSRELKTLYF